jgi:hypothetical protein
MRLRRIVLRLGLLAGLALGALAAYGDFFPCGPWRA